MKIGKIIVTVVVIAACVAAVKITRHVSHKAHFKPAPVLLGARVKGALDARLRITEFTDFQCPACAKAVPVIDELLKKYNGKFSLEHKYFPLPRNKNSMNASLFAECAAQQGKFWPYHDVLFRSQDSWAGLDDPAIYFQDLSLQLGLDDGKMKTCLAGKSASRRVDADKIEGEVIGVNGTPSFLIEGKIFVGVDNLRTELEARFGK